MFSMLQIIIIIIIIIIILLIFLHETCRDVRVKYMYIYYVQYLVLYSVMKCTLKSFTHYYIKPYFLFEIMS
jgi:hypothetical protein